MLAHPLARQQNNSCHTHSHKHAERARERGLKKVKERVEGSGRERKTGRVCRCAFVCESLEAFGDGNWKLSLLLSMAPSPEMTATGALLEAPEHIIGVFP